MADQASSPASASTGGDFLAGVCLRAESGEGAVVAWRIDDGVVGDVEVPGVVFVVARQRAAGGARQVVFVDERVTPEQLHRLLDAVHGRLGGSFGVDPGTSEELGFYQVPIAYERDRRGERVSVLNRVEIVAGPYATEGGGPGGWQPRAAVTVSELGMAWEAGGGAVHRRPFRVSLG